MKRFSSVLLMMGLLLNLSAFGPAEELQGR